MCVWYSVSLFVAGLWLTASAPTPEDCETLTKPLSLDKPAMMFGRWIFIEGYTDHELFDTILKMVNSSFVDINATPDIETIITKDTNMINGKCNYSSSTMTIVSNTLDIKHEDSNSTAVLLPTCPDCLVFNFNSVMKGQDFSIHSLYILSRNRTVADADLEVFRKQAECLKFSQPANFLYNPEKDFCPDEDPKAAKSA